MSDDTMWREDYVKWEQWNRVTVHSFQLIKKKLKAFNKNLPAYLKAIKGAVKSDTSSWTSSKKYLFLGGDITVSAEASQFLQFLLAGKTKEAEREVRVRVNFDEFAPYTIGDSSSEDDSYDIRDMISPYEEYIVYTMHQRPLSTEMEENLERMCTAKFVASARDTLSRVSDMCSLQRSAFSSDVQKLVFDRLPLSNKMIVGEWKNDNPADPVKVITNGGIEIHRMYKRKPTNNIKNARWILTTHIATSGHIDKVILTRCEDALHKNSLGKSTPDGKVEFGVGPKTTIDDVIDAVATTVRRDTRKLAEFLTDTRKFKSRCRQLRSIGIDYRDPEVEFHSKGGLLYATFKPDKHKDRVDLEISPDGKVAVQFQISDCSSSEVKELIEHMKSVLKGAAAFRKIEDL